jgi:hypothetical protein
VVFSIKRENHMQNTEFNRLKLLLDTLYFPLSGGRINGKTIFTKLVSFCSADKKKVVSIENGMIQGANVTYYGICPADQAGNQFKSIKIQGIDDFALRPGATISVKFAANNSYTATSLSPIGLNVNNTGAKTIYYDTGTPTGTDVIAFGKANVTNTYVYDGTYWVFTGSGEDVSSSVRALMLELCYPVGSIYISTKNVSPQTFLGGTWKSKSGYVLRGATSGVNFNSDTNDGGADSVTVSSVASHNHTQNAHSHPTPNYIRDSTSYRYAIALYNSQPGGAIATYAATYYSQNTNNQTATNKADGADYTVNTLPKYKNVYIWERTA